MTETTLLARRAKSRFHAFWLARALALVSALACAGPAAAQAPSAKLEAATASTPLDKYFEGLNTLRATFTQNVKDARGKDVDRSSGTLVISRPGKFRWEVDAKPGSTTSGQLLVADGRNVWFFDKDLEQVTVKPADAVLSSTPAMLLSGATNIRESFTLTPAGARDGLEWVLVEPRRPEADFRRALFGFARGNSGQGNSGQGNSGQGNSSKESLQKMIIDDRLGQTATIELASVERNARVAPEEVSFTPPAGVDVIGTPAR